MKQQNEKMSLENRETVIAIIDNLYEKILKEVPDEGDFPSIYSQRSNADSALSITDIGLSIKQMPKYLEDSEGKLMLELAVYQLPIPYKGGVLLFAGTKEEALAFLKKQETLEEILKRISSLADHFNDL